MKGKNNMQHQQHNWEWDVVWKPHHFLVFEAWFTNAQSLIIGCYECLSNAPVRSS